jgi:hypothetical protein
MLPLFAPVESLFQVVRFAACLPLLSVQSAPIASRSLACHIRFGHLLPPSGACLVRKGDRNHGESYEMSSLLQ